MQRDVCMSVVLQTKMVIKEIEIQFCGNNCHWFLLQKCSLLYDMYGAFRIIQNNVVSLMKHHKNVKTRKNWMRSSKLKINVKKDPYSKLVIIRVRYNVL